MALKTHSVTVDLIVTPMPDFSFGVVPQTLTTPVGTQAVYQVDTLPVNGFSADIQLSLLGLPAGMTAYFDNDVIVGGLGTAMLYVDIPEDNALVGNYQIIIIATEI